MGLLLSFCRISTLNVFRSKNHVKTHGTTHEISRRARANKTVSRSALNCYSSHQLCFFEHNLNYTVQQSGTLM